MDKVLRTCNNTTILVRNHEQRVGDPDPLAGTNPYDSGFAGPTFSPDGQTYFVNFQNPGITFAIGGRSGRGSPRRRSP